MKLDDGKNPSSGKNHRQCFSYINGQSYLAWTFDDLIILEKSFWYRGRQKLIKPINSLDLEHPLDNVCYEELKPLLTRVDQQNLQIACQLEELKKNGGCAKRVFCKCFP